MPLRTRGEVPAALRRRLVLACLTALLTGLTLGLAGPASAVQAPQFTGSPGPLTNNTSAIWTWTSATGEGVVTECVLATPSGPEAAVPCASGQSFDLIGGQGDYLLTVTVTRTTVVDGAATDEIASATSPPTELDTGDPAVSIFHAPTSPSTERRPTWGLSMETGAVGSCALVGPAGALVIGSCTEGFTADLTGRSEGIWTLTVTATNQAGSTGEVVAEPYVLDVAPAAPTVTAAASPGNDPAAAWTFTVPAGATAECSLTQPGGSVTPTVTPCSSPWTPTLSGGDGSYTASVVLVDDGGPSTAGTAGYLLDTQAPGQPVVNGSEGRTAQSATSWAFPLPEGTEALCRLDAVGPTGTVGTEQLCTSPFERDLPDGSWQLTVGLRDAAGNRSLAGASPVVTVDTTSPAEPVITAAPVSPNNGSAGRSFTWNWTHAETAECTVTRGSTVLHPWQTCPGGMLTQSTVELADGPVTLRVRSSDDLQNRSGEVPSVVVLDTVAPGAPTITGTSGSAIVPTAAWSWSQAATDRAQCQLLVDDDPTAGYASCTSGQSWDLAADARYSLRVRLTDAAGNTGGPGTGPSYLLDRVAPAAPGVTGPIGPGNDPTVTWAITGEPGAVATCRLLRGSAVVTGWKACHRSTAQTLTADGDWVLQAFLTDAAGNTSFTGSSAVYALDTVAPGAPVVSGPTGPSQTASATWTWTGDTTANAFCRLLRDGAVLQAWARCSTSETVRLSGDGRWLWQVELVDPAGNRSGVADSPVYVHDTTAPLAPTVTGPTGPSADRTPVFTVEGEAAATVQCRLLRGTTVVTDWAACSRQHPADLTGQPDGGYVVEARLTDLALNRGPGGGSAPFVLDTIAPTAPVVSGSGGDSPEATPRWTWTGEAGTTARCQLVREGVAGEEVACTSPYSPTLTVEGSWQLRVRLTDVAGNASLAGSGPVYRYDTTAPLPPTVTPPSSPGREPVVSWSFAGETGAAAQCRLRGTEATSAWVPCVSLYVTDLTGRPDGGYVLDVRLTDPAGNTGSSGAAGFVLDRAAPVPAVVSGPTGPAVDRAPSYTFTGEPGATYTCQLAQGATVLSVQACTSPTVLDLAGRPDGSYTLGVRVTDAAGNPSSAITATYVLDSTAPTAPVFSAEPATAPDLTPTWQLTAEAGAALLCRVLGPDGVPVFDGACTSPFTADLTGWPDGAYVLQVRARDQAGNTGVAASSSYLLDTTAPDPVVATAPATPGNTRSPVWTLVTAGIHECRLIGAAEPLTEWTGCAGSFTGDLTGQPDGGYTLRVRTRDAAGNLSAETRVSYVLDTVAPALPVVTAPPSPSSSGTPAWTLVSSEPAVRAGCRLLRDGVELRAAVPCQAGPTGSDLRVDLSALPDGRYRLEVRLTDLAGNTGAAVGADYVYDTSAPAVVQVTPPSSPGNARTPEWLLTPEPGAALECRFAAARVFTGCALDGRYVSDLTTAPDSSYPLAVRAVDVAGNVGSAVSTTYVLDTAAPSAPVVAAPASPASDPTPTWVWAGEPGARSSCVLTWAAGIATSSACAAPFSSTLPADGSYTLTVRLTDAAGNRSEAGPASYLLDTAAPAAPVLAGPSTPSSLTSPFFSFTAESGAAVQCRLSSGRTARTLAPPPADWQPCAGSMQVVVGDPGTYRLEVRATDAAGNGSPASSYDYVYDPAAPAGLVDLVLPTSPDSQRRPRWTFTAPAGARTTCELSGPDGRRLESTPCSAGFEPAVPLSVDGDHLLRVLVVDVNGNRGVNTLLYQLDATGPAAPSVTPVLGTGRTGQVQWGWTGEAGTTWQCRLLRNGEVAQDWAVCGPGPTLLNRWGEGAFVLEVVGTDAVGNRGLVGRGRYTWDATGPAALGLTTSAPASGSLRTLLWSFPVPADARTVTCGVRRDGAFIAQPTGCSGSYLMNLSGQPDGSYALVVVFVDAAGNMTEQTGRYVLTSTGPSVPRPAPAPTPAPGGGGSGGGSGDGGSSGGGGGSGAGTGGTGNGPTGMGDGSGGGSFGATGPALLDGGSRLAAPGEAPALRLAPIERSTGVEAGVGSLPGGVARTSLGELPPAAVGGPPQEQDERRGSDRPGLYLAGGGLTGARAVEALRDVAGETIRQPQIPIALLLVVGLFLLVQNRIDRRDPKLAGAPLEAEPELVFTPRPGHVPPVVRSLGHRTGGSPA